jgi:putative membrane protein
MTRHPDLFIASAIALAASLALSACNRPDEPVKPITGSAESAQRGSVPDATASGTMRSSGATSTSPEAPARTATTDTTSPGSIIEKNPTAAGMPPAQLSAADKSFLKAAAEDGLFEVEIARLAADHASDSAVKSYAAMLVDQHSATNDKLRQIAASGGVQLPTGVPPDKQKQIDKLSKATGPEFDKQFVQTVGVKDHKDAIDLFEKASKESKSAEVREFASTTLPTLKAHLDAAQKLPKGKG